MLMSLAHCFLILVPLQISFLQVQDRFQGRYRSSTKKEGCSSFCLKGKL
ncbi:hypothetical protein ERO13_A13G099505v2 [Gossypium hirsutum]|nr:hypothetical protein ERO13_A13G099505v2 [Gossypium hirsutum]